MLDVETVAAGGGSILAFDGLRARAGPASAGADPGPACYGRGGPATVTDANLVLGRLDATAFPAVFGPSGDQPLDAAAARARLGGAGAGDGRASVEAAAEGFVAVAVEQMAQAVRRISTERGFDPREHALTAFGGAAGQVACQTAEALGVERGALPALRQRAVGLGHRPGAGDRAAPGRAGGAAGRGRPRRAPSAASPRSRPQPAPPWPSRAARPPRCAGPCACATTAPTPNCRSRSDAEPAVRAAFEAAHQRLFGFIEPQRTILIAAVEAEAVSASAPPRGSRRWRRSASPLRSWHIEPGSHRNLPRRGEGALKMFALGAWHDAPLSPPKP